MKPLSETLTELGIAFSFPIVVKEALGMILVTLFGVCVVGLIVATIGAIASAFNL